MEIYRIPVGVVVGSFGKVKGELSRSGPNRELGN